MKSWLILAALAGVLAGCSGGGATGCGGGVTPIGGSGGASGASNGCGTGGVVTPTATDLIVTVATTQSGGIRNTGNDTATITVQAVDSNRNVVADVPVTIQGDSTSVVTPSGTTTDATGTVTGTVTIGDDRSDRTIAVSVLSGTLSKVVNIPVTGATLKVSVPTVVQPGADVTALYTLVDAANAPMAGVTVTITGTFNGSGTTDANGNYAFAFTAGATAGQIELDAAAAGTSLTTQVTDSSTQTIPPANGVVVASSVNANLLTVPVNPQGSQSNQVEIRALYLADHNAPLQNVRVRFDLDGDPNAIGGTLASGTNFVYSDDTGLAITHYIPGTRASGSNGVIIRACWDYTDFAVGTCPHQDTLTLTVRGQSVSLNVGTDGLLAVVPTDSTSYQQAFSVQVVDSAGNPMPGVAVSYKAIPTYYRVGQFVFANSSWLNYYTDTASGNPIRPYQCLNEDINSSNTLNDFGSGGTEDQNGDLQLTPRAATIVIAEQTTGSSVTDQWGRALFYLQYQRNYAYWIDYMLTFGVSVEGSEGAASFAGTTAATVADVTGVGTPAWVNSPYGSNIFPTKDASGNILSITLQNPTPHTVTDSADGISKSLCGSALDPI